MELIAAYYGIYLAISFGWGDWADTETSASLAVDREGEGAGYCPVTLLARVPCLPEFSLLSVICIRSRVRSQPRKELECQMLSVRVCTVFVF